MNRRTLLAGIALAPLAACTTTTTGGVTTTTINVAEVNSYGQAVLNAVTLLSSAPGVSALIAPYASAISAATAAASSALTAFTNAAAGSVTVTFNGTSAGSALISLLADAQTVFTDFKTAIGTQVATLGSTVSTYYDAFTTVVSLLQAIVNTAQGTVSAPVTPMTPAQALNVLHVVVGQSAPNQPADPPA